MDGLTFGARYDIINNKLTNLLLFVKPFFEKRKIFSTNKKA